MHLLVSISALLNSITRCTSKWARWKGISSQWRLKCMSWKCSTLRRTLFMIICPSGLLICVRIWSSWIALSPRYPPKSSKKLIFSSSSHLLSTEVMLSCQPMPKIRLVNKKYCICLSKRLRIWRRSYPLGLSCPSFKKESLRRVPKTQKMTLH